MSLLWLLPLLGLLGWVGGLTYPYYRFFNTSLALMLLTGMGAWVAIRWAQRRHVAFGAVVSVVILAGLGFIMVRGFEESNWNSQALTARFLDPATRSGLAAAQGYIAASDPDRPVVFVVDYRHGDRKAWGWAKTYSNVARSGLEGDEALRTAIYFGDLDDFVQSQPTGQHLARRLQAGPARQGLRLRVGGVLRRDGDPAGCRTTRRRSRSSSGGSTPGRSTKGASTSSTRSRRTSAS